MPAFICCKQKRYGSLKIVIKGAVNRNFVVNLVVSGAKSHKVATTLLVTNVLKDTPTVCQPQFAQIMKMVT